MFLETIVRSQIRAFLAKFLKVYLSAFNLMKISNLVIMKQLVDDYDLK